MKASSFNGFAARNINGSVPRPIASDFHSSSCLRGRRILSFEFLVISSNGSNSKLLCRKLLINTRLQPGAHGVRREKNRLNGFSWARSWFTALKRGVNEIIFTEQLKTQKPASAPVPF
jgi:hypothetical protein